MNMKKLTTVILLFLWGCHNSPEHNANESKASKDAADTIIVNHVDAEPGTILFEANEILNKMNIGVNCRFEYAQHKAPNLDIVGETSYMEVKINATEAKDLINLFYKKCHDSKLEQFDRSGFFTPDMKYDLKAYFNIAGAENSYFTCLIRSGNKYAYYVLGDL